MSKLKTKRGAAKRFKATASGGYRHRSANRNHILTKKSVKRKRHLRAMGVVAKSDQKTVDSMIN